MNPKQKSYVAVYVMNEKYIDEGKVRIRLFIERGNHNGSRRKPCTVTPHLVSAISANPRRAKTLVKTHDNNSYCYGSLILCRFDSLRHKHSEFRIILCQLENYILTFVYQSNFGKFYTNGFKPVKYPFTAIFKQSSCKFLIENYSFSLLLSSIAVILEVCWMNLETTNRMNTGVLVSLLPTF